MKHLMEPLRADIDKALAAVAKKHKLASLQCKPGGKYSTGTCTFSIEAIAAGGVSVEAERYTANAGILKLKPLGSAIEHLGRTYTSIGLNSTGTKVLVRQAVTDKEYLMPVSAFKVSP